MTMVVTMGLLSGAPRWAEAIPMVITLDALRTTAPTVVIATFLGPVGPKGAPTGYDLLVERALQGTPKLGPMRVLRSKLGAAHLTPGTRIVAFMNASNEFGWVGTLMKGKTLEDGVLALVGFTDINAYGVSPSRLTLEQLEHFLSSKTATLVYDFEGALWFPSAKGPAPSAIKLKVHYDDTAKTSTVSGMPPMTGFPAKPRVVVTSWYPGGDVAMTWVDTLGRPLAVGGEVTAVAPSGTLETKFFADAPASLTEPEFRAYLADPKLNHPYHELSLALADGTKWTMQLGRDVGHIGELTSPTGAITALGTITMAPTRTIDGGALQLVLGPRAAGVVILGRPNTTDTIIQELLSGTLPCTATKSSSSSSKPLGCTIALTKTAWAAP